MRTLSVQRERVTSRALQDVEALRQLVYNDLDMLEGYTKSSPLYAKSSPLRWLRPRAMADLRTLRKVAASDINRVELQILQGDPTLTFLRDTLRKMKLLPQPQLIVLTPGVQGFWLREQFERGALRDPALISALLEQARLNPELVARLVSEAKDRAGRDFSKQAEKSTGGKRDL